MKICYLDAFSGISGDMTVGALVDAGAPADELLEALRSLGTGARYEIEKTKRRGIAASKFRVHTDGVAHPHRHLAQIFGMIDAAPISGRAKEKAAAIFERLGQAEAQVHGSPIQRVHFHEVGAADSLADIVGACIALDLLDIDEVHVSAINVGSGTAQTEHGVLPVPAPATAVLLAGKPVYARGPEIELTTPTGAAIAATLGVSFGPLPAMRISAIGYGAGDRDFPQQANVLRATIGEKIAAAEATLVSVIEANIDDSSPQVLGYALERLMEEGALDVSLSPIQMKKNRPGTLLRVIARQEDQERLAQIIFAETSTLGLRVYSAERRVQERSVIEVETPWGAARGKVSGAGAFLPEYEDCRAIAHRTGTPLAQVMAAAADAYLKKRRRAARDTGDIS
ncbi:MAG TPA: nickel pincer cofactor biosynthesis protein LarC [Bryobacteraceae bacterium]|nr:nickel pincer cofactor biosynthesis protein LarC [Bryobacteraceae bacterium]